MEDFKLDSAATVLSFAVSFGLAKALGNLVAGRAAVRVGRKRVLLAGWALALAVGPLIALAPSWSWIVAANALLGASQGLSWSMTLLMKSDLAAPRRQGLVIGLNESSGYVGMALAALATGFLAAAVAPRTAIWVGALALSALGLAATLALVRETAERASAGRAAEAATRPGPRLALLSQAGFANNMNDALIWGLVPLLLAGHGATAGEIGLVAGIYPALWGLGQFGAGWLADRRGCVPLIVGGMLLQGGALGLLAVTGAPFAAALPAAVVLGVGTALAYPALLASVISSTPVHARPAALGVYRFWRDLGLACGALLVGLGADSVGPQATIAVVGGWTAASGLLLLIHRKIR